MKLLHTTINSLDRQEVQLPENVLGVFVQTSDGSVYRVSEEDGKLEVTLTATETGRFSMAVIPRVSNSIHLSPAVT